MSATTSVNRRQALATAGIGAGALALAACGSSSRAEPAGNTAAGSAAPPAGAPAAPTGGGAAIARVADIPVGGSVSGTVNGKPVLLSQPTAGTVVCFSAICTHQGCTVKPAGAKLDCPCHKSVYDAATGAVISGPAPAPLPAVPVTVSGASVVLA